MSGACPAREAGVPLTRACTLLALLLCGCPVADDDDSAAEPLSFVAMTFNTGTSEGMGHDAPPDDGYGSEQAAISDTWYGDGLAWSSVVEDTRAWFAQTPADLVGFQEIFYSGDCATIPPEGQPGFVCEGWEPGDPTVAHTILGDGWQVACHQGKTDKCLAVRRAFGTIAGCDEDLCLDGLDGGEVDGCGNGSRVGRAVIELAAGGTLTAVNVHGTSGLSQDDEACRLAQFQLVFEDLGDGEPAANGERNVIVGDFNTDPARLAGSDPSAAYLTEQAEARGFSWHSQVGTDAVPTYAGLFNIDHVLSDGFTGQCWAAGVDVGRPDVSTVVYFDHKPTVCPLSE